MIKDRLPSKLKGTAALVQGWVDKKTLMEVRKLKEQNGWSWDELLEACLRHLLEEMRQK